MNNSCSRHLEPSLSLRPGARGISLSALLLSVAFVLSCTGCSTGDRFGEILQPAVGSGPSIPTSYEDRIEQYSDGDQEYAGFYNNFEFKATLWNAPIRDALLDRQADYYKWDATRKSSERDKLLKSALTETKVFLSFFTPTNKNDNLDDAKKIWEIYLTVGGQRYAGVAKRNKKLAAELKALYPYNNVWGTPYDVTFPVSINTIENQASEMMITGPLGARSIHFRAIQ